MKRTLSVLILIAMLLTTFAMPMSGAAQAEVEETGTYLILFEDTYIPDDFVQQVAHLGGTIEFSHEVGIAIVSGLTEAAAAELGERKDISVIEPDSTFQLDSFPGSAEQVTLDAQPASPDDPTAAYFYGRQWNMPAIHADEA